MDAETIAAEDLTVEALDGYPLAASLFEPDGAPRAALVMASATAVRRGVYAKFASYLSERGIAALTFDYRGIAGSAPADLRGFAAPMKDWALKDIAGVVDWLCNRYPGAPLLLAGHSFGAQALALTDRNVQIDRALMVAGMTGHWRNFAGLEGLRTFLLGNGVGLPLAALLGHVPGSLGMGENVPYSIYSQWMRWCRDPDYFFGDPEVPESARAADYGGDILVMNAADDPWTTQASTAALVDHFTAATKTIRFVDPADYGLDRIGHTGFFRSQQRDRLWPEAADWLLAET